MERLRRRPDFLAAAAGARAPTTAFLLQARQRREDGTVRVGFTVSRKVGGAVERNRVRRRLREVVRLAASAGMKPGYDYVLVGRRAGLDVPFARLIEDFGRALRRVHAAPPPTSNRGGKTGAAIPHPTRANEAGQSSR